MANTGGSGKWHAVRTDIDEEYCSTLAIIGQRLLVVCITITYGCRGSVSPVTTGTKKPENALEIKISVL